jgi:hypothetical protein
MPTRAHVLHSRFASATPAALGDGAAIVGAIACVLAAAILYLCFAALAILDDGDGQLGSTASPRVIASVRVPTAAATLRV